MSVYSYTTDSIETFEDPILYGLLTEIPAETIDAGNISMSANSVEINGYIVNTETLYPFGSAKVFGDSNSSFVKNVNIEKETLKLSGTITEGITFTWIGSGTLFEIGGGQERIVAPWVGSSGPLRFVGLSINKKSHSYQEFVTVSTTADDFGFVSSAVSSYQDFGTVFAIEFDAGSENYGSITLINTETSFSTSFGIKGSAISKYIPLFAHNGEVLFNISGECTSEFVPSYDSFGLFNVTGGDRYSAAFNNVSSTTIFAIGSKQESAIFDYNVNSTEFYTEEDFQFITSSGSTENYGLISLPLDAGIDSYGYVTNLLTENPFGSFALSGNLKLKRTNSFFGSGDVSINGNANIVFVEPIPQIYKYTETTLFNISGTATTALQSEFTYSGSGYSLNFGGSTLAITWRYTLDSSVEFAIDNYGLITQSGSGTNYGLVSLVLDEGIDSYGYITNLTTNNPFGTFALSGNFVPKTTNRFVGSGTTTIYGNSITALVEPAQQSFRYSDLTLFNIAGSAITAFESESRYLGSGSLFNIGSSTSSRTWNYTLDSEVEFTVDNYGLITTSGTVVDYGLISLLPLDSVPDSYGYITNLTTERPFGFVATFNGSAIQKYRPEYSQIGKGSIGLIGESIAEFIPSYDSFGLFDIQGNGKYSNSIINKSFGSIFTIGSKQETAVFDYNVSSVAPYSEEDFEFITSSGIAINYGSISLPLDAGIDYYGYITNLTTEYPFGSVAQISGSATQQYRPARTQIGQGLINVSGNSLHQYVPSYDSFVLFNITGGDRYSASFNNPSSGVIFTVGSTQETAVFDYNTSSISNYSEEDFEFITSSGSTENYGSITAQLDAGIDSYGYITNLTTEYPFGPIASISGSVFDRYNPINAQDGRAFINIYGESLSEFIPSYDSFGLFEITGGDRYSSAITNISSGVIFTVGSKQESLVFDYNTSSIVTYSEEDYEFITSSGSVEDYGLVSLPPEAGIDSYGYIINLTTEYPFGSIGSFSGSVVEEYEPIFGQIGEGSINISGESATQFVPTYNSFGLFDIAGDGKYSTTARNIFTITTLFTNGSKEESKTFNYTLSSIEPYTKDDFEFITSLGTSEDYGSLSTEFHSVLDSYGYITNITTEYPFGSIARIGGHAEEMYDPNLIQIGEGSINISGESATQFVPSYDSFGLFEITGGDRYTATFSNASTIILFAIGSKQEIATFHYNTSSVESYIEEDFEFITSSGTVENYGSITVPFDSGIDSYGYITNLTTEYPFGPVGLLTGSSISKYVPLFAHNGQALVNISGTSPTQFIPSYDSFGLFNITGGDKYSTSIINVSTAFLLSFGSKQESSVFDYNTSSVATYSKEDFEFIISSGSVENYGSIALPLDAGIDSYGYITNLSIEYPFGSIGLLSGSTKQSSNVAHIASGSLFAINGVAESVSFKAAESTALFTFNSFTTETITGSYAGSGSLSTIGSKQETAVFDYNISSVALYAEEDFEFITSSGSIENYGSITAQLDAGIDSYGYITNLTTEYPFGSIGSLGGHGIEEYEPIFGQIGVGSINISGESSTNFAPRYETFGLFDITGGDRYSTTIINVSTGLLLSFGSKEESKTFNYTLNSIEIHTKEDFGFIDVSGSIEDYGSLSTELHSVLESYGYITNLTTEYPFGSIATISGHAEEMFEPSFSQVGQAFITVSGESSSQFVPSYSSFGLFDISGSGKYSLVSNVKSIGFLLSFGSIEESAVFDYNTSSVVPYTEEDFEFITSIGLSEDYGSVTVPFDSGIDSYGYITNLTTEYPFGPIASFSGSTKESFAEGLYTASGSLFALNGVAESTRSNPPESIALFVFQGASDEILITKSYAGSGSLFNVGSKQESAAFSYNISSSVTYSEEDFEFITSIGSTEDYGSVSLPLDSGIDSYGYIINGSTEYPFGFIAKFRGTAKESFIESTYIASGSLFALNGVAESTRSNPPESTALFTFQGASDEIIITKSYTGFGSLFTIGSKKEIATFHYNTSSIVTYSEEDFEFITSTGTIEDYGLLSLPLDSGIDSYGYITNITTEYPFGSIGSIGGHAEEMFDPSFAEIAFAEIKLSGEASTNFVTLYESFGLFEITGQEKSVKTVHIKSSGTLFTIGSKQESAVFDYNTSSIVNYVEEDFEFITSSGTTEDYGSVSNELDSISDSYGYITNLTTEYPFGFIARFSGSASTPFTYRAEFESGSLFALNGVAESTRSNPPESTALLRISGRLRESFTEGNYTAIGRLTYSGFMSGMKLTVANKVGGTTFVSGSIKERQRDSYFGSGSLFEYTGASESVGANPPESTALFSVFGRSLESFSRASHVATGTLTYSGSMTGMKFIVSNPVGGTIFVSGSIKQAFAEGLYTGSGTLFTFIGASESVGANPPESTALFTLQGSAIQKNTESYVGVGNVYVSGELVERNTESYSGTGVTSIIGSLEESFNEGLYTGSGTLFTFIGASESVGANPPESTALFNIFGRSLESFTEGNYSATGSAYLNGFAQNIQFSSANLGSGFIYASGAVSDIKLSYGNVGSGSLFGYTGAAESKTVDIPEFFGIFNISGSKFEAYAKAPYIGSGSIIANGTATERNTESYVGSGTTVISGAVNTVFKPRLIGSGSAFIYGGGIEKQTNSYVGSGNLFGFAGVVESVGVSPDDTFGLFNIFGSAIQKNTESYVGSGNAALSGISDTRFVPNWNAFGSLFGYGGAAESKTVNTPQFFGLFNISGSKIESYAKAPYVGSGSTTANGTVIETNTESYVGSGNTSISGNAEFAVVPVNIGSGSIFVYGNVIEKQTDSYNGSGTLFAIVGSTESFTVNLQSTTLFSIFGKASESNTENYVGVGNATFGSSSKELFTPNNIGSGSLFAINGASESYAITERSSGLFEISGSKIERSTNAFASDGQISIISGAVVESHTEVYFASGSTSINGASTNKFSPVVIASGFVYTDGFAIERQTDNYVGYGSLFGFVGAVESVGVSPDDTFGLFNILGSAVEKNTESYVGSGRTSISGHVKEIFTPNNIGSGSINIIGFGKESNTEFYVGYGAQQISGFATQITKTASYQGYTEINISGYIAEKQSDAYIGSGSLFNISGSEISASVNPPESTSLFVFEGSSTSSTRKQYTGFGSIFEFNGSAESTSKSSEATGLFEISGSTNVIITRNYVGSGSLFAISGSSESITYDLPEFNGLYTVSGYALSSVTSNPPENAAQYVVSGKVSDIKLSHANKGFGSLFSIGGSSVVSAPSYTSQKVDGIKILGRAKESYAKSSDITSGTQFISGAVHIKFRPYEPPFTYVIII